MYITAMAIPWEEFVGQIVANICLHIFATIYRNPLMCVILFRRSLFGKSQKDEDAHKKISYEFPVTTDPKGERSRKSRSNTSALVRFQLTME